MIHGPYNIMSKEYWGKDTDKGTPQELGEKTVPVQLRPPQNLTSTEPRSNPGVRV